MWAWIASSPHNNPSEFILIEFEYGKGWFIKKTEDFFNRLVSLGMDKGSPYYDSCVLIFFRRSKDGSQISINLFSLSKAGMLKDVARQIKKSGEIIG